MSFPTRTVAAVAALAMVALAGCQTNARYAETGIEEYTVTVSNSADPMRVARLDAEGRCTVRGATTHILQAKSDAQSATVHFRCEPFSD